MQDQRLRVNGSMKKLELAKKLFTLLLLKKRMELHLFQGNILAICVGRIFQGLGVMSSVSQVETVKSTKLKKNPGNLF